MQNVSESHVRQENKVRWGILGPGGIAKTFFKATTGSPTGRVTALGARSGPTPELEAEYPGIPVHTGYEALLNDPDIDAIYVATPHPLHCEWVIAAAEAGKHVLCEKPMSMSERDTTAMFDAADRAGTFLGEAFMYRLHPLTLALVEIIRSGRIGDVRMIRSSFGFSAWWAKPGHRLFVKDLGGGALFDLGGYPVSMVRLLAGAKCREGFQDPAEVKASVRIGPSGVDEWTSAILTFPDGIIADVSCSISVWQDNMLHIMGSEARLEVKEFWFGTGREGGTTEIQLVKPDGTREAIPVVEPRPLYSFQFEAANSAILEGKVRFPYPGMNREDSIGNARTLDQWKRQIGLEGGVFDGAPR